MARVTVKSADESWRLFIAIELPGSLRELVNDHISSLRRAAPAARASWVRAENLHLTLKFLGNTPLARVEALSLALRRAAAKVSPFGLNVGGCGSFPPRSQPRVLWIGCVDPTGSLNQLYEALEDECAQAGFSREDRAFHPHLTVGRLRQPQGARRLAELHQSLGFAPPPVEVSDVCLIRSELRSDGSRYTVIARHCLDGPEMGRV